MIISVLRQLFTIGQLNQITGIAGFIAIKKTFRKKKAGQTDGSAYPAILFSGRASLFSAYTAKTTSDFCETMQKISNKVQRI